MKQRFAINLLKSNIAALFILCVVIIAVFYRLTQTFYQQDEWNGLGLVLSQGINSVFPGAFKPVDLLFVKGRLLSSLIFYIFAKNFPFQNAPLALLAIALHIIGTFLVFILIKKHVKNVLIALLGAIFFAVNSVSQGAITWPVVAINTAGSGIFILVALMLFFKYTESCRPRWLVFTALAIYVSLWFKETGLYLFLFLSLAALIFNRYKIKFYVKQFWWFFVPFFLIVGYRVIELRMIATDANLYLTGASGNFFLTLLIRMVLYPLTSFSLMFVPGQYFIEFAREVLRDNYPFFANSASNILIAQSVILDLLAVVLTGFILLFFFLLLRKEKAQKFKIILFWLIFTFVGFSPYVVLGKDLSYLESRYYYIPVVGAAVLFAFILEKIWERVGNRIFYITVLPVTCVFLFLHVSSIQKAIDEQILFSNLRKNFISQIKGIVPSLNNNKNVFYITSEQNYWADGNKVPFQQGTGYTLMVLYNSTGQIPKKFLKEGYLFDIGSQGYAEVESVGFGYFWDKEKLDDAVRLYNFPENSIITLYYNSKDKTLVKAEK